MKVRSMVVLCGALFGVLAAAACGGNGGTGGNGASTTTGTGNAGPGCSLGGTKCAFGCTPTVGCAECAVNADCTDPGKPACVLGKCSECGDGAGCGAAEACYPKDHKCEPKCAANGDCPSDSPICITDPAPAPTGTCVGCRTDADCAGNKDHPICEPTRARCSACASNADCGAAAPACDLNDGECHQCLIDADCPSSYLCGTDRKCHAACGSNADCKDLSKPFCDLGTKACVACLADNDCGAAAPACDEGKCVQCVLSIDCKSPAAPICKDNKCIGCIDATDCKDPLLPVCKDQTCVECAGDTDCKDPALPKCNNQVCVAK